MKINSIQLFEKASKAYNTNVIHNTKQNIYEQNNEINSYNPELLKNYFINFMGNSKQIVSMAPQNYEDVQQFDNSAIEVQNKAIAVAKKYGHKEANQYHVMYSTLKETDEFIDKLQKGEADLYNINDYSPIAYFIDVYDKKLFSNKDYLNKFSKLVKSDIKKVENILQSYPKKNKTTKKIKMTESYYNDVEATRDDIGRTENPVDAFDMYNGAFASNDYKVSIDNEIFRLKIRDILMLEDKEKDKRLHFPNYDKKAENIIKNLNMGTNVIVTYDDTKVNPNYFVPSLIKAFEKSNGKLNPKNTEIVEFNENVNDNYFVDKINDLAKIKDKNFIVIYSQKNLASNSITTNVLGEKVFGMTGDYMEVHEKTPKNIRIVCIDAKDKYLNYLQQPLIEKMYSEYSEVSIPVLNQSDVLVALEHDTKFMKSLSSGFSKKALDKVVTVSSQMNGNFPDKTINLLKKISLQYPNKKEITLTDVENYVKDADYLFKQSNKDSSIEIVFDTNKRLKDIIGKTNTKKEAEYVINQIKHNKIGTKGFIIYNQDGMAGGGRRHTAEVIAGEAKVPFVSINTMDFGTKEVDLFGDSAMSPEASIKKLFSLVNTQAEANPHKSAVLFIENFEYFSVGEMVSEYHQKAMAQLIREMENAEKKGLNIVVMGSVSNPQFIGEATMKSFKFNDNIEVSSTAFDDKERYEVLKQTFKDNKIKITGDKTEQDKLLKDISKTLRYFSFIELKSFVKKAESIAQERHHSKVDKSDLIESYLRITTGRPATHEIRQHEKELTTKHECGHAITLQIMNDLMKKTNKPWLIPDTVNFITLDPRGMYGGAMFEKSDNNREQAFEKGFTDIVCSYGGHSAEKKFYGMDGSWGITCDLDQVTSTAETMVTAMGQGFYTGKISLVNMYGEEDFHRNITHNLKDKIDADVMVITKNALTVSDMIVDTYGDFINEFAERYANLVGTGDCLIDGDQFRKELAQWKKEQSIEKQAEFDILDGMILDIIQKTKKGELY